MHILEKTVRKYYESVDRGDYEELYKLFDPEIRYSREGTNDIKGIGEFRKFYEGGRIIGSGYHKKLMVRINPEGVIVIGVFDGTLKNGDKVKVKFNDAFAFNPQGKIIKRVTTFPKGERQI